MSDKKSKPEIGETIHEVAKREKVHAKTVLALAKKQELAKIKAGCKYVRIDANTLVLRK